MAKEKSSQILAADLCQRVGILQPRHNQWVSKGLCRRIGKEGCTEEDAVELTLANKLMDAVKDIDRARRALDQLRAGFRRRSWNPQVVIVWDQQLEQADWADSNEEIGALSRHGHATRTIEVGRAVSLVVESYRRLRRDREKHSK